MRKKSILFSLIALVLVVGGGVFVFFRSGETPQYEFVVAARGSLRQEVRVTGRVVPVDEVALAFETGGRIAETHVAVGNVVNRGAVLLRLDSSVLHAQLRQMDAAIASAEAERARYRAARTSEQATLDALKRGTRLEELRVAETKVEKAARALADARAQLTTVNAKAAVDLENLYSGIPDLLQDAYADASDAVYRRVDALFVNDDTSRPELSFQTSEGQARIDAESQRVSAANSLTRLLSYPGAFPKEKSARDRMITNAITDLNVVRTLLQRLSVVVNGAIGVSEATVATYKSDLSTAQTNVNGELTNLNTQQQAIVAQGAKNDQDRATAEGKVNDAEDAHRLARDEFALQQAGSTQEAIDAQEARVTQATLDVTAQEARIIQAHANGESVRANIEKTVMRSPFAGVVTTQKATVGEIVSANTALVTIISEAAFEIEAHVPEADIAKVALKTPAIVTLDAYGDDMLFDALVAATDPAETIIDGVSTYTVTLRFVQEDERIKSGMTANITMQTDSRENVIVVPMRAVILKDGRKFVRILGDDMIVRDVDVTTGLRGSDGTIEVTTGLNEGQKVVVFVKE